jgi:hypothetical protein
MASLQARVRATPLLTEPPRAIRRFRQLRMGDTAFLGRPWLAGPPGESLRMKFAADLPCANLDAAVQKLLEIADAMEPDHAGRLNIGTINRAFFNAGDGVVEYSAAVQAAIDRGLITLRPSGGYLIFTQAGADMFA